MPLNDAQVAQVGQALAARGTMNACISCNRTGTLSLLPETAQIAASPAPNIIGGVAIPCVALICSNCGFVRLHALGSLGLATLGNRSGG